jgi:hypothetical protein
MLTALAVLLGPMVEAGRADILSIEGSAEASVQEFLMGASGASDQASDTFPGTQSTLPLQVVARLSSEDPNAGAASSAAQFADPTQLNQANPEEFAINLALSSISPNIRYTAQARAEEKRLVSFTASELGTQAGQSVELRGRLFIDGVLTVFSVDPARDLTGSDVTLTVTVVKESGQAQETVFSGAIELAGTTGGAVTVTASGDFPASGPTLTNLGLLSPDFGAFHVLVLPDLQIDYFYDAVADESFALVATLEVDAANVADEAGVAALLGTPVESLQQVITLTQGDQAAAKFVQTLLKERDDPTGAPAIVSPQVVPLFGLCGPLGFDFALGLIGLGGLRAARWGVRRG